MRDEEASVSGVGGLFLVAEQFGRGEHVPGLSVGSDFFDHKELA